MDGAVFFWPAFGALALGGALQLISLHRHALATTLHAAAAGTLPPRRRLVRGQVRPATPDPLVAPLSGEKCAWFRVVVRQNPGSRGPTAVYRWDGASHFMVGDVRIAARLLDRHLAEQDIQAGLPVGLLEWHELPTGRHPAEIARLRGAGMRIRPRRWDDYRISEYRLPVDRTITVLGRPRQTAGGPVLAAAAGLCGVSERPVEQLSAAARTEAAGTRTLPRVLLLTGAALLLLGLLLG